MGVKLFPHQEKAVNFCGIRLAKHKSAYLALAPGLGKTAVALTVARDYFRPLFICPPALAINVEKEKALWQANTVQVVTDTKIDRLNDFYDLVIVDEAHRFKTPSTARFKALKTVLDRADKVIFMSGTPMPNSRPIELLTLAHRYAPDLWPGKDYHDLLFRYCDPFQRRIGRGKKAWDFSGFSNEQEFYTTLQKSWLLRMGKGEIQLPEKREALVFVGKLPRQLDALDQLARKALKAGKTDPDGHLATYRRLIGLEKANQAIQWLKQLIQDNQQSVLLFCHHREVIAYLEQELKIFNPITIIGGMSTKAKQNAVDHFQKGGTKLAILSIGAAGVGITLTKADRVVMLESSWLDGDNEQAGDRAHRIGQKNSVLVQHVVLENSGDAVFLETALKKRDLHIDNF